MMTWKKWAVLYTLILIPAVLISCLGGGDDDDDDGGGDDDDDDDSTGEDTCEISGDGLTSSDGSGSSWQCEQIGLALIVDQILTNLEQSVFEVRGQFAINNSSSYYLRGIDTRDHTACFDWIDGTGAFMVRAAFDSCTDEFTIDVVTSTDPDAVPFCKLEIYLDDGCGDDDDDDDDTWYDDDDDTWYDCSEGAIPFSFLYWDCMFDIYDDGDLHSYGDLMADCDPCIIACYDAYDYCSQMEICIEDACGYDVEEYYYGYGDGPELSNGFWDPNPIVQDPSTGDWISSLVFDVCDPDDDLSGGQLFMYVAGTTDNFLSGDVYWDDFGGGAPSAPDCNSPLTVGIPVGFTGAPAGTYCCDLEATDGDGNFSNKLVDMCVTMP
jgi:hypothetical protein